jgi:hypothetical protein
MMPIPLSDICLGAVAAAVAVAAAAAVAAAVAAAEIRKADGDDYDYGDVVDSDDLRGLSLIFEESADDLGNFSVVVDDAHAVADDTHYHACCHYHYSWYHLYCYSHERPLDSIRICYH